MEDKAAAEALISQFKFERLLNQDQNGRRISLQGTIQSRSAILTVERAAFPSTADSIATFLSSISEVKNLGANDIYHWYLASTKPLGPATPLPDPSNPPPSSSTTSDPASVTTGAILSDAAPSNTSVPSLKLNLIYPCTEKHIKKYSSQTLRMVTETPFIYHTYVLPRIIQRDRSLGRLDWIFNIIEGRTEQEDIILRSHDPAASSSPSPVPSHREGVGPTTGSGPDAQIDPEGFLLLPDLNWDRKTISGLHLLALVERRDIWSLRDLREKHVPWLRRMREKLLDATVKVYGDQGVERDMLKLYIHYHPTYYHFHIHIVNVSLEPSGHTQSTGKAFGLENLISWIESLGGGGNGDDDAGMHNVTLSYFVGEQSDLWKEVFAPLKKGEIAGSGS